MNTDLANLARQLTGLPPAELHERLRQVVVDLPLPERFRLLHRLGVYHHPDTTSGAASTLGETAALRHELPRLVAAHGIGSLLDIPCGDFHWMQHVPLDVAYVGADIVPEIVRANRRRYESEGRRFVLLDATRDPLPEVDLILCRDLLVHLSLGDCRAALENFVASRSRLLLASHFEARLGNPDIVSGDFRPINLCRPPFRLPPPIDRIDERSALADGSFTDRTMALWPLAAVAEALSGEAEAPAPSRNPV